MSSCAKKGDWVQLRQIVLGPGQRSPQVPEDTNKVPLVLLTKGFLTNGANMGDKVTITTVIGREITGELVAINPGYNHSFGSPPWELMRIGSELRKMLKNDK